MLQQSAVANRAAEPGTGSPDRDYYIVRSGDTLSAIATRYGIEGGWHALYEANRQVLDDPGFVLPGQRLHLP